MKTIKKNLNFRVLTFLYVKLVTVEGPNPGSASTSTTEALCSCVGSHNQEHLRVTRGAVPHGQGQIPFRCVHNCFKKRQNIYATQKNKGITL